MQLKSQRAQKQFRYCQGMNNCPFHRTKATGYFCCSLVIRRPFSPCLLVNNTYICTIKRSTSCSKVHNCFSKFSAFDRLSLSRRPDTRFLQFSGIHKSRQSGIALATCLANGSLAASLVALMVGGIGSHYTSESISNSEFQTVTQLQIVDEQEMNQAFSRSLEKELSGTPVSWKNPDSGSQGQFVPVRTFQSKTGQYCREFEETRTGAGANIYESGIACRDDNGQWKVRLRYYPE